MPNTPHPAPSTDLAFLHTSALHVPGFGQLVHDMEPGARVTHHVREDLLEQASRATGAHAAGSGAWDDPPDPAWVARIHQAVASIAASSGASVIVCTCSTIGGIAETAPPMAGCTVTRIDRAMADEAVRCGQRLLMVAAVESTLEPTRRLLLESAQRMGVAVQIRPLLVQGAWEYYTQGNLHRYATTIAQAVAGQVGDAHAVVLAQASMAPVSALLGHLPVRLLSSPSLGVAHALRLWRRQRVQAAPGG